MCLTDICVTGSEDKRRRRKSGSHFSEARKRGRTMLYHLTSQFSRGGKREVNLGGVSTFPHPRTLPGRPWRTLSRKINRQESLRHAGALNLELELLMLISKR